MSSCPLSSLLALLQTTVDVCERTLQRAPGFPKANRHLRTKGFYVHTVSSGIYKQVTGYIGSGNTSTSSTEVHQFQSLFPPSLKKHRTAMHKSLGFNVLCEKGYQLFACAAQYLGEKLAGDSSRPGLDSRAALLLDWGCSGVVSARFWEPCWDMNEQGTQ